MSRTEKVADLQRYDEPCGERAVSRDAPSEAAADVERVLIAARDRIDQTPAHRRLDVINELLEAGQVPGCPTPKDRGVTIRSIRDERTADGGWVRGEWLLGRDADPSRRMLFVHGGGFVSGSPLSHRPLTLALAERTGMAVLSIQYRMLGRKPLRRPTRVKGLRDVRASYDWILEHGPEGDAPSERLVVAGDSAGGNLVLSTLQWARDSGRRAADAAVAFCPVTDVALNSPSTQRDFHRDLILGHFFARIHRVPALIRNPLVDLFHGGFPGFGRRQSPMISPLFGDLSELPPTLIQGSESELLRDDAKRYTNKARQADSEVVYQTWPGMMHVFQMFESMLPEGREALDQVVEFLAARDLTGRGISADFASSRAVLAN